ncbi:hypothetical protein EDB84DRAFT_506568 [Lactarius hengduanensis]|nr:hypothetical protein EDB84DRAFT_506568 [Lactarius hengduanensis]
MCNPDNRPTVGHEIYFFPDGDIVIRVEDTVFCVHTFFLTRESNHFRSTFISTVPCQHCQEPPGTESNPIVLRDATSEAFAELLWVFYNREYSNYNATLERWKRILALAHQWGFVQVKKLCVQELEKLTIPPVEKIKIYQDYNLNPDHLYDSYVELVTRLEPLNLEEGKKLGFLTSLKITHARQLACTTGPDGATSSSGSEIQLAIRDIFRLWGSAPAPPMTTDRQSQTSDDHVDEIVPQTRSASQRATISSGSASTPPSETATARQNPTRDGHVDEVVPRTRSASQATVSSVVTANVIGGRVPVYSQTRRTSTHPFIGFIAMLPMLLLFIVFALGSGY